MLARLRQAEITPQKAGSRFRGPGGPGVSNHLFRPSHSAPLDTMRASPSFRTLVCHLGAFLIRCLHLLSAAYFLQPCSRERLLTEPLISHGQIEPGVERHVDATEPVLNHAPPY